MSEGFLSGLLTYLDENKVDIAKGAGKDAIVSALEQSGLATIRQSGRIVINEGIKGPEGENSFYMASEEASDKSNKYNNRGKWLGRIGKGFGGGLSVYGLYSGYTEDREENNKTVGEAVTHNAASFGAGAVGAGVATALLVSNPVGWAAVGSAAVVIGAGTVASMFFETAYDSNFLGLQDKLDWAGNQIDAGWEGTKNIANNVGEAVSDGLCAINPMNWAW